MKITKKLLTKMVKEELIKIKESSRSMALNEVDLASWDIPRLLQSLIRLVGPNPGSDRGAHQTAMEIIKELIAKAGPESFGPGELSTRGDGT